MAMKAAEMKQLSQDSIKDEINNLIESMKESARNGNTSITPPITVSEAAKSWLKDNGYCFDIIQVSSAKTIISSITWD
jgi:hypothetical protein